MRIFVCEFLTGGGLCSGAMPESLLHDARRMIDALLVDLRDSEGLEIVTTRDARLGSVPESTASIGRHDDPWTIWSECMRSIDAAWVIAPESGGILLALRSLADACRCRFIGCEAEAIRIAGSKIATMQHCSDSGIACIETVSMSDPVPPGDHGWIVKPDDGAGCEGTYYFDDPAALEQWRDDCGDPGRYVVQPRVDGVHASLSLLRGRNGCDILACNEQAIDFRDGRIQAGEVRTGALRERSAGMQPFADDVIRSLPGLNGYFGIDFIATADGPVLVEINPRLTTSYAGLRETLGYNPAERILQSFGYLSEITDQIDA